MKKKIKDMWIRALRSGKYKQAKESLRVGNRFCCLGVLCDLYRKQSDSGGWSDSRFIPAAGVSSCVALPEAVVSWAGLPDRNNNPYLPSLDMDCIKANDSGKSFKAIAAAIAKDL